MNCKDTEEFFTKTEAITIKDAKALGIYEALKDDLADYGDILAVEAHSSSAQKMLELSQKHNLNIASSVFIEDENGRDGLHFENSYRLVNRDKYFLTKNKEDFEYTEYFELD